MNAASEKEEFSQKQGLDMKGLLGALWQTRYNVIYSILMMAMFLIILFFILLTLYPKEQTFQSAVNFKFLKNNSNGNQVYPNNLPFSLNDLTSPIVLEKVYKNNLLEKTDIDLKDFPSLISVTPYSLAYQQTAERYRLLLKDRKLTFGERQKITEDMSRDLQFQSQNNALIQLHFASAFGISPMKGHKIVTDIPKVWSQISIEQRGVLKTAQEVSNQVLINQESLQQNDFPMMLDILEESLNTLKMRLYDLKQLDGAETISDPKTGKSVYSLTQEIKEMSTYELPSIIASFNSAMLSKDPVLTQKYFEERIFKETQKYTEIKDRIAALNNILEESQNSNAARQGGQGQIQNQNISPQIDQGFLDKITEMVKKSENSELREKLIFEKLGFQKRLAPINYTILNLKRRLEDIMKYDKSKPGLQEKEALYSRKITEIGTKVNLYWEAIGNLFRQLSSKRYSYSSQLYENLALEKNVINYHFLLTKTTMLLFFLALVLAGLVGMFIGLFQQKKRYNME